MEATPPLVLRLLVIAGLRKKNVEDIDRVIAAARVARFVKSMDRISNDQGLLPQIFRLFSPVEGGRRELEVIEQNIELSIGYLNGQNELDTCGPLRAFGHEDGSVSLAYCFKNALPVSEKDQKELLFLALDMIRQETRTVAASLCAPHPSNVYSEAYFDKPPFYLPCSGLQKSKVWEANLILNGQRSWGRRYSR